MSTHIDFNKTFDYYELENNLERLTEKHPKNFSFFSVGRSWENRKLYCVRFGNGSNKVILVGAHHGSESGTSAILTNYIFELYDRFINKTPLSGYDLTRLYERASIYIIPMLNPDGVSVSLYGPDKESIFYDNILKFNNNSEDFSSWKANARGVDLNHNYSSGWTAGKQREQKLNLFGGAPENFGGEFPESENETRAMAGFTRNLQPQMIITLHYENNGINYNFNEYIPPSAEQIGVIFSSLSGFPIKECEKFSACGGYREWFIDSFNKPGFTFNINEKNLPLDLEAAYSKLREAFTIAPLLIK